MKKRWLLLAVLPLFTTTIAAQKPVEKGLQSINQATAEAQIEFLASDLLEGREAGTRGCEIAAAYIASSLKQMGIAPLLAEYEQPFAAYAEERQRKTRYQVHPDSVAKIEKNTHRKLNLNNILGMIKGVDTTQYVIVGAHYDHLGVDPTLVGDKIYNGADDNATGVSAVLQIAQAFMASGKQPARNVIFAFWDGEEKGLLGSAYYVQTAPYIKQVKGYLNFDMIGRNSNAKVPAQVDYFYTEAYPCFGDWIKKDIKKYDLNLVPVYHPWDKPIGGSDNASFARHDIPIIWYHTNGHPDYHQPSDHAEKLNWEKVVDITKASYLNMWSFANDFQID